MRLVKEMKRASGIILVLCSGLLLAAPFWGASPKVDNSQEYSGEITDSICAKNGSHEELMDQMKVMGRDKKTCTNVCVQQLGAKYVLYNASTKKTYALDDQNKAATFAGQTVQVVGTLEKNKIKLTNIEAAGR
jgi:hypothetical protein